MEEIKVQTASGRETLAVLSVGSPFLNERKNEMESEVCFSSVQYAVSAD